MKRDKVDRNVLAEGEATGHYHQAVGNGVGVFDTDGGKELEAPNGASVKHQEHKEVKLPPGDYDVSKVMEYDHAEEESRKVID